MDPIEIIRKFYPSDSKGYTILINHSTAVAEKAVKIAEKFNVDRNFIYEAAMLHDIGIFMTHAPKLGCYGKYPYIAHGYLGREILEKEGFPRHALVCERHTGVGITMDEIEKKGLPLPLREMTPQTLEEKIIAYADKFFSKEPNGSVRVRTVEEILEDLAKHGDEKVRIFREWVKFFEGTTL